HGHGLVHLVAHHAAREGAGVGRSGGLRGGGHFAPPFVFCVMKVCTRAIWRRTRSISLFFVRLCVAICMRRPNCARRSSISSFCSSSPLFERRSSFLPKISSVSRRGVRRTPS